MKKILLVVLFITVLSVIVLCRHDIVNVIIIESAHQIRRPNFPALQIELFRLASTYKKTLSWHASESSCPIIATNILPSSFGLHQVVVGSQFAQIEYVKMNVVYCRYKMEIASTQTGRMVRVYLFYRSIGDTRRDDLLQDPTIDVSYDTFTNDLYNGTLDDVL
jgi:hypothetical protein